MRRHLAGLFASVVLMAISPVTAAARPACSDNIAILNKPDGSSVAVNVEIADDAEERALGLMGRKSLAPMSGMLFVYETPRPASFWMKNTLIPLDILFFDASGVLRHIHPQARPLDLTPIPGAVPGDSRPDRLLVLEVAGGEAGRHGLNPGVTLSHPSVPQSTAIAPCR